MNEQRSESAFPTGEIDRRQLFDTAGVKGPLSGPLGILDDRIEVFRSGQVSSSGPSGQKAMTETLSTFQSVSTATLFTRNGDYQKTRREITELLYIEEDEDFTRPTSYALDLALDLLENANAKLVNQGHLFPRGASSTSENGGIYIFWRKKDASIQLEVPPRAGGLYYIHVISRGNSSMNRNVSPETLADTLAEFNPLSVQRRGTMNAPASAIA